MLAVAPTKSSGGGDLPKRVSSSRKRTNSSSAVNWPQFRIPRTREELFSGKDGLSPEQTLVEFISTSAAFHGVKKQPLRSLEWDLLKVFPNNVMPANAAAWYMAKRKFYMNQAFDQQLLPFLLKKFPDKFRIIGNQVIFLEIYSKEVAREKLLYLVQYGLHAYFSHKADEFGVYFFDPLYYENTEPFHESMKQAGDGRVRNSRSLVRAFFSKPENEIFQFQQHSGGLVSICKQPGVEVTTNATGVIVSMINSQYGFIKFGSSEKALFCAKSVFKDGWQYSGDPLQLPAMKFDGYRIPGTGSNSDSGYSWYAVLVWCGRKPNTKFCSTAEDLNSTPVFRDGRMSVASATAGEKDKLRQPSGSMMVGQVLEVRRNGAVVSLREDSNEKVFIPGWKRILANSRRVWLSTENGECIGEGDIVAYYLDTEVRPGYNGVGKNVMVLKEKEAEEVKERSSTRRRRKSTEMSAGADYKTVDEKGRKSATRKTNVDTDEDSDTDTDGDVSDGELEWLEKDLGTLLKKEDPKARTITLLKSAMSSLKGARSNSKVRRSGRMAKEDKPGYKPIPDKDHMFFWRMKKHLASLDDYESGDDEDYKPGDYVDEIRRPKDSETDSSFLSTGQSSFTSLGKKPGRKSTAGSEGRGRLLSTTSTQVSVVVGRDRKKKTEEYAARKLPYWVRALSLPEKFDPELGRFAPIDTWYKEEMDPDYELPTTDWEDEETGDEEEWKEELDQLVKESEEPLEDCQIQGKHKCGENPVVSPVKITLTPVKEGEGDQEQQEILTVEEDEEAPAEQKAVPVAAWVTALGTVEQDEEYDSEEDPEFIPPAVFYNTEHDYDEFTDSEIEEEEATVLKTEGNAPLQDQIPKNYLHLWVPVASTQERITKAKEQLEAKAAAQEKRAKARAEAEKAKEAGAAEKMGIIQGSEEPKPRRERSKSNSKTEGATEDVTSSVKKMDGIKTVEASLGSSVSQESGPEGAPAAGPEVGEASAEKPGEAAPENPKE